MLASRPAAAIYYNPADFLDSNPYALTGLAGIGAEVTNNKICPTTFPATCANSQASAFPDMTGSALIRIVPSGYQGGDKTVVDPSIHVQADVSASINSAGGYEDLVYYFDVTNLEGSSIVLTGPDTVKLTGQIDYTPFADTPDGGLGGNASLTIIDTATSQVIFSKSDPGDISTSLQLNPYTIYSVELNAQAGCSALSSSCEAFASVDPLLTLDAADALNRRIIYSPGLLPGGGASAVPEPSTFALLLTFLAVSATIALFRTGGWPTPGRGPTELRGSTRFA